jgi:hypothetical protein
VDVDAENPKAYRNCGDKQQDNQRDDFDDPDDHLPDRSARGRIFHPAGPALTERRLRVGASGDEVQYFGHLIARNGGKFCYHLVNVKILEVSENGRHRYTRTSKHPCATDFAGDALQFRA